MLKTWGMGKRFQALCVIPHSTFVVAHGLDIVSFTSVESHVYCALRTSNLRHHSNQKVRTWYASNSNPSSSCSDLENWSVLCKLNVRNGLRTNRRKNAAQATIIYGSGSKPDLSGIILHPCNTRKMQGAANCQAETAADVQTSRTGPSRALIHVAWCIIHLHERRSWSASKASPERRDLR